MSEKDFNWNNPVEGATEKSINDMLGDLGKPQDSPRELDPNKLSGSAQNIISEAVDSHENRDVGLERFLNNAFREDAIDGEAVADSGTSGLPKPEKTKSNPAGTNRMSEGSVADLNK